MPFLLSQLKVLTDRPFEWTTEPVAPAFLAFLLLAACGGDGGDSSPRPIPAPANAASEWQIGPIVGDHNYSNGLPTNPTRTAEGFELSISSTAEPHYVTKRIASLAGKTRIVMRYRADGPPGTVIFGKGCSQSSPSAVTLYLEETGAWQDQGDGGRWWATGQSVSLGAPGEWEIVAPLDGLMPDGASRWTSIYTMTAKGDPERFIQAKAAIYRAGFTFANCEGFGHGARATAPVKVIVTTFIIE